MITSNSADSEFCPSHLEPLKPLVSRLLQDGALRCMGIVGCSVGVGASTVSWKIAKCASLMSSDRVLLIDASGDQYSISRQLGLAQHQGLSEVLRKKMEVSDVIQLIDRVAVMPFGKKGVLCSQVLADLLATLRLSFGSIVVDLPLTAKTMARSLDSVLLVIGADETTNLKACRRKRELVRAGANVAGAILNKSRPPS